MEQQPYESASYFSIKWGLSRKRIGDLCRNGRIPGAIRVGNIWAIPSDAVKPKDARSCEYLLDDTPKLKPFIKWAGGKGQILDEIRSIYPDELGSSIRRYAEPFIGGGAVLFDILGSYELDEIYISDVNRELLNVYRVIKERPDEIISSLSVLQKTHIAKDMDDRKAYFYENRSRFNEIKMVYDGSLNVELASLFVYLNKTCFNGLYRVNAKGLFNTPSGVYTNPMICDEDNIRNVSEALKNVSINHGDFTKSYEFIDGNTFAYFDPPYRPLTVTASFTSYTEGSFNDDNQRELAQYARKLWDKGAKVALSNSDPKNSDPDDNFFDDLYDGFNIRRIYATRAINSKGDSRGKITELLITNY